MFKSFLDYMNLHVGQAIDKGATWCENHTDELAFFGTHVLLPSTIGLIVGSIAGAKRKEIRYVFISES